MKIAGVSVNVNNLPSKEDLIKAAINTEKYRFKRNAKVLILKEIKESGVYKSNKAKSTKPKAKSTPSNRRLNNTKQS